MVLLRFRAWLKEDKEMVDVEEINFYNGEFDFIGDAITWMCKSNDCVLMQSTGLTDKNGKEIFEGDVVKMAKNVYSEPTYYEVVRHRGGAYRLESKQYGCELWLRHTDCEIAGDIYKNPELLEVSS
nr:MAG: YopX protein [Bacteriophage sp.]